MSCPETVSSVLIPDTNLGNIQTIGLIVAFLILAFMLGNFRLVLLTIGMYSGSIGGDLSSCLLAELVSPQLS
jgi:hypothetical protein